MIDVPKAFTGGSKGATVTVTSGNESQTDTFDDLNQYQAEVEHFSDCILNGREPMLSPEDAKKNTAVIVALKRAAQEEKAVPVG